MAAVISPEVAATVTVPGRDSFSIVVACDLEPPQVSITRPHAVGRGPVDARACFAVWTAAHAAAIAGDCVDDEARGRACITASDPDLHAHACCAPGANPLFDAAVRDFAIAASRTSMRPITADRFDFDDDVVTGELTR